MVIMQDGCCVLQRGWTGYAHKSVNEECGHEYPWVILNDKGKVLCYVSDEGKNHTSDEEFDVVKVLSDGEYVPCAECGVCGSKRINMIKEMAHCLDCKAKSDRTLPSATPEMINPPAPPPSRVEIKPGIYSVDGGVVTVRLNHQKESVEKWCVFWYHSRMSYFSEERLAESIKDGEFTYICPEQSLHVPEPGSINTVLTSEVRKALADYLHSEGYVCFASKQAHEEYAKRLAEMLNVPARDNGSGYDFQKFKSKK